MKIFIHITNEGLHPSSWLHQLPNVCKEFASVVTGDIFESNLQSVAKEFDAAIIMPDHFTQRDVKFIPEIADFLVRSGVIVFPGREDIAFFDDKVKQSLAFVAHGISTPETQIFYSKEEALMASGQMSYPLVKKLRRGSGSFHVSLIESAEKFRSEVDKMFGSGQAGRISFWFKFYSAITSIKSSKVAVEKIKKIPGFIRNFRNSKQLDVERDYFYTQNYIENEGFDFKVVVVNNKLSYLGRPVRPGDFRASGGGVITYDRGLITKEVIDLCSQATEKLKLSCVGFDLVKDKESGKSYIIEMSYGFSRQAILDAGEYYDLATEEWIEASLDVAHEVGEILKAAPTFDQEVA